MWLKRVPYICLKEKCDSLRRIKCCSAIDRTYIDSERERERQRSTSELLKIQLYARFTCLEFNGKLDFERCFDSNNCEKLRRISIFFCWLSPFARAPKYVLRTCVCLYCEINVFIHVFQARTHEQTHSITVCHNQRQYEKKKSFFSSLQSTNNEPNHCQWQQLNSNH